MYQAIEESLTQIGSIDDFLSWEFLEENNFQGINGVLLQNYFTKNNTYKMIGISILNGVDIRSADIYNNVVTSRVAEEGIFGITTQFSILFEEFTEQGSTIKELDKQFIEKGFDKICTFHPTKRSIWEIQKDEKTPSWKNINKDDLYEEFYLIKENKDTIYLINLDKIGHNQYTIYFDLDCSISDATVYKKSNKKDKD